MTANMRLYFINAVLSFFQIVAQAHERLPIASGSISFAQATGVAARRADDHRRCHYALDGVPYPLVIRVLRGCRSSRAHDPVRVTPLNLLVTRRPCVVVTIMDSVTPERDNFQEMFFEISSCLMTPYLNGGEV
ncbi:hypothetical protein [Chloroflexus sp.]|uniref:hypothetical protein n=1 Tax=Chloroflexus sp. TaxID=1904827 RepID=UPI002ADDC39E|nr:hypothetical protein [Chloroflexus sp.]